MISLIPSGYVWHVRYVVRHPVRYQTLINKGSCGMCGIPLYTHARTRVCMRAHPRTCALLHTTHAAHAAQVNNGAGVMPHGIAHKSATMPHNATRARPNHFFSCLKKKEVVA